MINLLECWVRLNLRLRSLYMTGNSLELSNDFWILDTCFTNHLSFRSYWLSILTSFNSKVQLSNVACSDVKILMKIMLYEKWKLFDITYLPDLNITYWMLLSLLSNYYVPCIVSYIDFWLVSSMQTFSISTYLSLLFH